MCIYINIIAPGVFFHIFQCSWKHHDGTDQHDQHIFQGVDQPPTRWQPSWNKPSLRSQWILDWIWSRVKTEKAPIKYHTYTHRNHRTYTYIYIYASNPIQSGLGQTLWKPGQNKSNPMQPTPNHKLIVYTHTHTHIYIYISYMYYVITHVCIYIYILLSHPHTTYIYIYICMAIHI